MKKQIAIFEEENAEQLETLVNEFLDRSNITVCDIKPLVYMKEGEARPIGLIVIYYPNN